MNGFAVFQQYDAQISPSSFVNRRPQPDSNLLCGLIDNSFNPPQIDTHSIGSLAHAFKTLHEFHA